MYKVFIDGKAGTTGLRIYDRLSLRKDIELLTLSDEERKNPSARKEMINQSDITFLCLPDDAARESVSLVEKDSVCIIDTSTAHRTESGWSYGFPELSKAHRDGVVGGNRIAVPGCHASGFIALVYPLVNEGIIAPDYPLSCFSITGYSGAGKKVIADYESDSRPDDYDAPRQYATAQSHKHLKEMKAVTGIDRAPVFSPIISPFYSGMEVTVPLFPSLFQKKCTPEDLGKIFDEYYNSSKTVKSLGYLADNEFVSALKLSGKDSMELAVRGNEERIILTAVYDNLGKGASGAAMQCMNIKMGADETEGLVI